eukprot:GHVS01033530.1.p1 GENE.GHVS01033530.1~~GHVS01033530.1.p1  ORF type:complete len:311 (-),score=56.05 GHVS01033530.1:564-1496(-)
MKMFRLMIILLAIVGGICCGMSVDAAVSPVMCTTEEECIDSCERTFKVSGTSFCLENRPKGICGEIVLFLHNVKDKDGKLEEIVQSLVRYENMSSSDGEAAAAAEDVLIGLIVPLYNNGSDAACGGCGGLPDDPSNITNHNGFCLDGGDCNGKCLMIFTFMDKLFHMDPPKKGICESFLQSLTLMKETDRRFVLTQLINYSCNGEEEVLGVISAYSLLMYQDSSLAYSIQAVCSDTTQEKKVSDFFSGSSSSATQASGHGEQESDNNNNKKNAEVYDEDVLRLFDRGSDDGRRKSLSDLLRGATIGDSDD